MLDVETGAIAKLNGLLRQRKGARNQGLGGDDGRGCREPDQRKQRPAGCEEKKRLLRRGGIRQEQRALAKVVQEQRRQDEREPRHPNRPFAEVPHIRVQRFTAGDDQKDCAEDGKPVPPVLAEE